MNINPADAALDPVWIDRGLYVEVEERHHEMIRARSNLTIGSLAGEVARARLHIKNSLDCVKHMDALSALPSTTGTTVTSAATASTSSETDLNIRVTNLERENQELKASLQKVRDKLSTLDDLRKTVKQLKSQVDSLNKSKSLPETAPASASADANVDLFGSDSEDDEEASKIRNQRLKAYQEKKSKKPALIAKSSIIFDVKPWDDETDMANLEAAVRSVQMDGLLWGASKLVPLAYGIHKLQINSVIEDEKISVDQLQENIESFEDYVQSVDIFAFNKI